MFKKLAIVCMALAFVGCAQIAKLTDKSSDEVAKAIAAYCANTDEFMRTQLRDAVNAKAAPNHIKITCAPVEVSAFAAEYHVAERTPLR